MVRALELELNTYDRQRARLEDEHLGKFVLICGGEIAGIFDDFQSASEYAARWLQRRSYLIHGIGADRDADPVRAAGWPGCHVRWCSRIPASGQHVADDWSSTVSRWDAWLLGLQARQRFSQDDRPRQPLAPSRCSGAESAPARPHESCACPIISGTCQLAGTSRSESRSGCGRWSNELGERRAEALDRSRDQVARLDPPGLNHAAEQHELARVQALAA
jgi:hypothetical protein